MAERRIRPMIAMRWNNLQCLFVWVCCFLAFGLRGQTMQPIDINFSTLSWKPLNNQDIFFETAEGVIPLEMNFLGRAKQYHYIGPNPIVFFRELSGDEGKTLRVPVASVALDPAMEKPLLLFFQIDPEKYNREYIVTAIEDSEQRFPRGSYQIMNLSGTPLVCSLEGEYREVGRGQIVLFQPELAKDEKLILQITTPNGTDNPASTNRTFFHDPWMRWFIFLRYEVDSHNRGVIHFKSVPDRFDNPNARRLIMESDP